MKVWFNGYRVGENSIYNPLCMRDFLTDLLSNQNCDSSLIDYDKSRTDSDLVILERYRVSVSYDDTGKISRVS